MSNSDLAAAEDVARRELDEKQIKDAIEKNKTEEEKLQDRVKLLEGHLDRLTQYLVNKTPSDSSQNEGTVDTAIRLLESADLYNKAGISKQLAKLSDLVIKDLGGEHRRGESSGEMAIRLLTEAPEDKDDRIIRECKKSGEPYIVFRAKDTLALGALQFYLFRVVDEKCPADFVEKLKYRFEQFEEWRNIHAYRTRMPD